MKIEDYDKERATILNALYCSVKSAMQTKFWKSDPEEVARTRFEWIDAEIEIAKKKLEAIEAEMRVLLGDPFAEEEK